jgi:hypothetical protein
MKKHTCVALIMTGLKHLGYKPTPINSIHTNSRQNITHKANDLSGVGSLRVRLCWSYDERQKRRQERTAMVFKWQFALIAHRSSNTNAP